MCDGGKNEAIGCNESKVGLLLVPVFWIFYCLILRVQPSAVRDYALPKWEY